MTDFAASSPGPSRGLPSCYRGARVLVTGATGFIGMWVSRQLRAAGAEVWVVGRSEAALRPVIGQLPPTGGAIQADLARLGAFGRVWNEVRPAVVFNLAGYGVDRTERDADIAFRMNAELVEEVGRVVSSGFRDGWTGMRLVHAGSAFEYGSVRGPVTEDTVPAPLNLYGRSKLDGSRRLAGLIEREGLAAVNARICTVYGPGEHATRLLPSLIGAAANGHPVRLTAGEQERDFVYVRDVAEALLGLGAQAPGSCHVVNVGTGTSCSVRRFAETAAEALGMAPGRLQFGAVPYREDEVWQGPVCVDRLRDALGWVPSTAISDGIRWTYRQSFAAEVGIR